MSRFTVCICNRSSSGPSVKHRSDPAHELPPQGGGKLGGQAERRGHAKDDVVREDDGPVAQPLDAAEMSHQVEVGDTWRRR